MKHLLTFLCLFLMDANMASAEPWTVGQQTLSYATGSTPNHLGDGVTDAKGGQAPAFAYEFPDVSTDATTVSNFTSPASSTVGGQFDNAAGTTAGGATGGVGHESKARFDCNDTFEAHDDPILAPGVPNGSTHDHTFFGNVAFANNAYSATYAGLRSAGNSSCFGGPLNRTLYWEPSLKMLVNGVVVTIRPYNLVTYYTCGAITVDPDRCTRWPRGFSFIDGFNMSDPTDSRIQNAIAAANAVTPGRYSYLTNGLIGWKCESTRSDNPNGQTIWAPNQGPNQNQPYLYDPATGHATLDCDDSWSSPGPNSGIELDLTGPSCWDGVNLQSPDGRKHTANNVIDHLTGTSVQTCPNGWYQIPQFSAKVLFPIKSTELSSIYLSSDRMPGMTQYRNGESAHFDLLAAWDYGTGDHPGAMLTFFQNCDGLTMHVKNSDGTTFTDLAGNPHECGTGRTGPTTNMAVGASPDGSQPDPIVNETPDRSGAKRYYPIKSGTPLSGSVIHTH